MGWLVYANWLNLIAFITFEFANLTFSLGKVAKQVLRFLNRACELTRKKLKVFKLKSHKNNATTVQSNESYPDENTYIKTKY